jgi:hypothetical protein
MAQEAELSSAALTVQAQAISPNDNGQLLWDAFFPRNNVDSVKFRSISDVNFRPTADRREWNQRGRVIDMRTPAGHEWEMVPIESTFGLNEREMQELEERTLGNEAAFRDIIRATIPQRVDTLVEANYRRIEVDAFTAWSLGQITAMNPQTGGTQTLALPFTDRYEDAGANWDATDAYENLLAWLADAPDALGGTPEGVMLRQAMLNMIVASAPNFFAPDSTLQMTRRQLEQRISDEIGSAFTFVVNERTVDVYTDAGITTAAVKLWPEGVIAAIPQGGRVGSTHFAPVVRAAQINRQVPQAQIDVRGVTVYSEPVNGGRGLLTEAQINALPMPVESRLYVIDATPT